MTIDELRDICDANGVRPQEVVERFGYTRHYLYVKRTKPLPEIVRYALPVVIQEIKSERDND